MRRRQASDSPPFFASPFSCPAPDFARASCLAEGEAPSLDDASQSRLRTVRLLAVPGSYFNFSMSVIFKNAPERDDLTARESGSRATGAPERDASPQARGAGLAHCLRRNGTRRDRS